MYLNDGQQITSTPTAIRAAFNTLPIVPKTVGQAYYHVPRPYTDEHGITRYYHSWNAPKVQIAPNYGTICATPTTRGAYFVRNTAILPGQ
jgi:hypothetical protein